MAKRTNATEQATLRDEAAEILEEEVPSDQPKELEEKDMPLGEEGVEYYLFPRDLFYGTTQPEGIVGINGQAVNPEPLASKSDVLKFCRSAEPGMYVLVKVMDELEVAPPKEANIVRSNPRLKKPRKDGAP